MLANARNDYATVSLVASFCNFFFQKEKVERSFLARKKRGFAQFFLAKNFKLFFNSLMEF